MSCAQYSVLIHDLNSIDLDIHVLQAIVFIGGYAVHSYLKTTNCHHCNQQLSEDKVIEITDAPKYDHVRYIDRGSLKLSFSYIRSTYILALYSKNLGLIEYKLYISD